MVGALCQYCGSERRTLAQLAADEEADGTQQLQVLLLQRRHAQESVHQIHGQREHVVLTALLLTYLHREEREKKYRDDPSLERSYKFYDEIRIQFNNVFNAFNEKSNHSEILVLSKYLNKMQLLTAHACAGGYCNSKLRLYPLCIIHAHFYKNT